MIHYLSNLTYKSLQNMYNNIPFLYGSVSKNHFERAEFLASVTT